MTPEIRKTLLDLLAEYGNSLTRIQAEKELLKMMEQRALVECETPVKAFKAVATAHWRDTVALVREELESQADLFDAVRAAEPIPRSTTVELRAVA